MSTGLTIRLASLDDADSIWAILEPVVCAGETYTLPCNLTRDETLAYWFAQPHEVYVAIENESVLGTYFLTPNQRGGGSHIANCGYVTAGSHLGRGVARQMCLHSLNRARKLGFRGMQFNFVVSTNERAVHLWQSLGFEIVGRLPAAFLHPAAGYVDAFVMFRSL